MCPLRMMKLIYRPHDRVEKRQSFATSLARQRSQLRRTSRSNLQILTAQIHPTSGSARALYRLPRQPGHNLRKTRSLHYLSVVESSQRRRMAFHRDRKRAKCPPQCLGQKRARRNPQSINQKERACGQYLWSREHPSLRVSRHPQLSIVYSMDVPLQ